MTRLPIAAALTAALFACQTGPTLSDLEAPAFATIGLTFDS